MAAVKEKKVKAPKNTTEKSGISHEQFEKTVLAVQFQRKLRFGNVVARKSNSGV